MGEKKKPKEVQQASSTQKDKEEAASQEKSGCPGKVSSQPGLEKPEEHGQPTPGRQEVELGSELGGAHTGGGTGST